MEKNDIEKDLISLMHEQTNYDVSGERKKINVFSKTIGMQPRDFLYLIQLIENRYNISIDGEDIEKYKLKTAEDIIELIYDKTQYAS